jgi:hypothetical protein
MSFVGIGPAYINRFILEKNMNLKALKRAYANQKYQCDSGRKLDAAGNKVEFRLSFEEWLDIWEQSGCLDKRGIWEDCYVMARHNDLGHYEIGNVSIRLHSDNVRDAQIGRKGYDRHGDKNPFHGKKHNEETIQKCREARLKQSFTEESKMKMGSSFRGKKQSPEHIAKRIAATQAAKLRKKALQNV